MPIQIKKLIVGLGNYGDIYDNTRHNVGFQVIGHCQAKYLLSFEQKFHGLFAKHLVVHSSAQLFFLKPHTYMNNSGQSVAAAMRFFKLQLNDVIVLHDDLDLDVGRIKVKIGGGDGGHNGLKSIDSTVGKNYTRLRIGIGRPKNVEMNVANYVLEKFTKDEALAINQAITACINNMDLLIFENNKDLFMNRCAIGRF